MQTNAGSALAISRLWEWFWRGRALRDAQALTAPTSAQRECVRRASLAMELADRAVDPGEPLEAGSPMPLAVSLYREATYWALVGREEGERSADLSDAFARSTIDFSKTGLSQEELGKVRAALVDKTFIQVADEPPEQQNAEADLCQTFVHALIDGESYDDRITALLIQRWLRVGVALLVVVTSLFATKVAIKKGYIGADLALGKKWRASSAAFECHPEHEECGGAVTSIFFHTNEENKPWVEIDLGSPQVFKRIEVENRPDCCEDRAVPLFISVSDDQQHWRKIARRTDPFQKWELTFEPVKARYIQLKVNRRSILHLAAVRVWAR
jgi:hypothetical protein